MANPRADTKYTGIQAQYATYSIDDSTITYDGDEEGGSAQVGLAVTLSTDDTVALVADAQSVLGKLIQVAKDGFATVQFAGYMELPAGDGATLTLGKSIVGDLGADNAKGYIREVATGTAAELGVARGMIQNNDTTTAVVVLLY